MRLKSIFFILIFLIFMNSCSKKEPIELIPPNYETVTIGYNNMITSYDGKGEIEDKIFSFELQENLFIIDKDLDNFDNNYSYILKSKTLNDSSYIGIKMFDFEKEKIYFEKDIEREILTNIGKGKSLVDLGNCLITGEGSNYVKNTLFIKKCNNEKFLIQIINDLYEDENGNKSIGYKAYNMDEDLESFFIQELYKDIDSKVDSYNYKKASIYNEKNKKQNIFYERNNLPNYNGKILISNSNKDQQIFLTNRELYKKNNFIFLVDIFIDKTDNIDFNFPLLKNFKILFDNFDFSKINNKFRESIIFRDIPIKINNGLLIENIVDKKNTNFISRYGNFGMNIEIYSATGSGDRWIIEDKIESFIKDFGFKGKFNKIDKGNFEQYNYKGEDNTYILIAGKKQVLGDRDRLVNNEYMSSYIYIKVNNKFLEENPVSFSNFISGIK